MKVDRDYMRYYRTSILLLTCCFLPPVHAQIRGRLANPGFVGQPVKTTLFFSGQARDGVQYYECTPGDNRALYTDHPLDIRHLRWSQADENRRLAVTAMSDLGFNVISMSYWGEPFLPCSSGWNSGAAPMQTSTYSHDELFSATVGRPMLIMPFIESRADWSFRGEFPGAVEHPAPGTASQIIELINRYLKNPQHPEWQHSWAQVFDRSGEKRYAVVLIHVASDLTSTDTGFAAGFDNLANYINSATGIRIGFFLDALPQGTYAPGSFKPSPVMTGPYLASCSSVIAVQCFIPEVWFGSNNTASVLNWKQNFSQAWHASGVPFLQDIAPGYDAHIVFPGAVHYGYDQVWRQSLLDMVQQYGEAGLVFNSFNGYTEGMSALPSQEYGATHPEWVRALTDLYRQSLKIKIFLSGAFNAADQQMDTALQRAEFLPRQAPYTLDPRQISDLPDDTVDWLLLRLRKTIGGPDHLVKSVLLRKDGCLVDDNLSDVLTLICPAGDYYVVIDHRNHLSALSATAVHLQGELNSYDFTVGSAKYAVPSVALEINGQWALRSGDIDQNGTIDMNDRELWYGAAQNGLTGYRREDVNLDGEVNSRDFILWFNGQRVCRDE